MKDFSKELTERAKKIRAIFFDVDGVLTNGSIIYDNNGLESKQFNVKDGQIIKYLKQYQIATVVITGRDSRVVRNRCNELSIDRHYHGVKDKGAVYEDLKKELHLHDSEIAYVGDDINDLPILSRCGLSCTPADGHWQIKEHVHWILSKKGGEGALRELADMVLLSQGKYEEIINKLLKA
jgi:3-deoxy-D-manno-octulosonate 8-phosphate phosphatase (KDO 8-P phosphatase)